MFKFLVLTLGIIALLVAIVYVQMTDHKTEMAAAGGTTADYDDEDDEEDD